MPETPLPQTEDSLIQALPELVAFIGRDGTVLRELGGRRLGLAVDGALGGRRLSEWLPESTAAELLQRVRKSLHDRGTTELQFRIGERCYDARIAAHGRDRVLCVIRDVLTGGQAVPADEVRSGGGNALQRRALFDRVTQSVADAALRERPLALLLVHLQGLGELGRILDFSIVEQMSAQQLERIRSRLSDQRGGYAGRMDDDVLLAVLEGMPDREAVRLEANRLIEMLGESVTVGDATFSVAPSAGIAILGEDGRETRALLESARTAMMESRRSGGSSIQFYSDTLQLRSLARLDTERELREAIDLDQLDLRYAPRHCLDSGHLIAVHAYLRWPHPVRGEVAPAEFLPIAESTGLANRLSSWALSRFRRDIPALRAAGAPGMRFSFGALRSQFTSAALESDVEQLFASGALLPSELELRISERVVAGLAQPGPTLRPFSALGVHIVVDEFGRGFTSLPRLARLPLEGLQLDRRVALSAGQDPVARRAAAAALAVAKALELKPMSAGIDTPAQRRLLLSLGCAEGLGDVFPGRSLQRPSNAAPKRRAAR